MMHILIGLVTIFINPGESTQRQNISGLHLTMWPLDGYDPVSYFQSGPLKGKSGISYDLQGVKYFFANEANKNIFITNPSKYEPLPGVDGAASVMALRGEKGGDQSLCYKIIQGRNVLFWVKHSKCPD